MLWLLLAELSIDIETYDSIAIRYKDRKIASLKETLKLMTPDLVSAQYTTNRVKCGERYIPESAYTEPSVYTQVMKKYILNSYERDSGWCPFCRGNGIMLAIGAREGLMNGSMVTMPYKLPCLHTALRAKEYIEDRSEPPF